MGASPGPPPSLAASKQELGKQLRGLHQLHIQLETVIAFLEGREPKGVPVFDEEDPRALLSASASPALLTSLPADETATEDARAHFAALLARVAEIQRDFGRLREANERQQAEMNSAAAAAVYSYPIHVAAPPPPPPGLYPMESKDSIYEELDPSHLEDFPSSSGRSTASQPEESHQPHGRAAPRSAENNTNGSADATSSKLSAAHWRLQVQQLRRQVEARGREIARLQAVVHSLEAQMMNSAVPKAVMAQAAELQSRNSELQGLLRQAQAEVQEARGQAEQFRLLVAQAQHDSKAAAGPAAAAVQESLRLEKRVRVLETQNAKLKEVAAAAAAQSARSLTSSHGAFTQLSPRLEPELSCSVVRLPVTPAPDTSWPPSAQLQPQNSGPVDQWHEGKKLRRKIELLQAKTREQAEAAAAGAANQARLEERISRLQEELAQSQGANKKLQAKVQQAEARAADGTVPASALQSTLRELHAVVQQRDTLQREVAVANAAQRHRDSAAGAAAASSGAMFERSPSASPGAAAALQPYNPARYIEGGAGLHGFQPQNGAQPPASAIKTDLRILDLELERDLAIARAARAEQRLDAWLAELGQSDLLRGFQQGGVGATQRARRGKRAPNEREQELLDTVALLRAALEKTRKGLESGVSSAKFMQAVEKAKQAAARAKQLEAKLAEAEAMRGRLTEVRKEAADAQVLVSALRGQLREAKRRAVESNTARDEIMNAQVAELERAVQERDAQLAVLKQPECEEALALAAEGLTPKMLVQQLMATRAELAELRAELLPRDADVYDDINKIRRDQEELRLLSLRR